ncbi:amidohydrolase family protein [Kribbella hippodromi]
MGTDEGHPILLDADATLGRNPRVDVGSGTVDELLVRMDRVGIRTAVVSHTTARWHDPRAGNARLMTEIAGVERLLPSWVVLPDRTGEMPAPDEFVAEALAAGVVAVRAYPEDHGYDLAGPDCTRLFSAVAAAGLPVLVDLWQTSWGQIETLADAHPTLSIVVGELGYRVLRRAAGVLDRCPNVYLGTAHFASHLGLEWLVQEFAPERLVFGTGMPARDPAEAVTRLLWSELADPAVTTIAAGTFTSLIPTSSGARS